MIDSVKLVIEADGETRTIIVPPGSVRQATLSEGSEPLYPVDSWPPPRTVREWDELVRVIELRVQAKDYVVATAPTAQVREEYALLLPDGTIDLYPDAETVKDAAETLGEGYHAVKSTRTPWMPL